MSDDNVPAKKCILKPGVISAKESPCELFEAQLEAIKSRKYKDFGEVTACANSILSRDVPASKVLLVWPEVPELPAGMSSSDVDPEEQKTCQQNDATKCSLKPGVISAAEAACQLKRQKHKDVTARLHLLFAVFQGRWSLHSRPRLCSQLRSLWTQKSRNRPQIWLILKGRKSSWRMRIQGMKLLKSLLLARFLHRRCQNSLRLGRAMGLSKSLTVA